VTTEQGVGRRLARLGFPDVVHLLALDHGMSLGWTDPQDLPPVALASRALANGLRGVVAHRGLIARMTPQVPGELIMQLHGSTAADSSKSQVAEPIDAVRADCAAVAVEVKSSGRSQELSITAKMIMEAHLLGMPVLGMSGYGEPTWQAMTTAVICSTQLGADIIKVALPPNPPTQDEAANFWAVARESPPLLLAGGPVGGDLQGALRTAERVGFRGTCIGRNDKSTRRSIS
jgi:DhnA family fructose-bisphosphate aldolase class Ia